MMERYRTLIVLEQSRSFTEAAKYLFCSQPTVSQHIQQLEKELNCQIIIRKSRQIAFTEQGKVVLAYAKKIVGLDDQLREKLVESTKIPTIQLYISHYIVGHFFQHIFNEDSPICKDCPYELNSFCYDDLRTNLLNNKAKFALMPIYDADKLLQTTCTQEVLFEDDFVFIMRKDHPLAQRQTIYMRDLNHETILLPQSFYLKQEIVGHLQTRNVHAKYVQMASFEIIKKAVVQGLGVSFLPCKTMATHDDQLIIKSIKGFKLTRKNGLMVNRHQALDQLEISFCQHIKKQLTTHKLSCER